MERPAKPDIAMQIDGALQWWRDAGVDCDLADDPTDWLAKEAAPDPEPATPQIFTPPAASAPPPRPLIGGAPESWPQDLGLFQSWWLSEPSLDHRELSRRVPPRGIAGAELMVLVADPEDGDTDVLLSGPRGKLLAGMFAALGLTAEQTYLATALPRTTPLPDWRELAADGLGALVAHHIFLAAPKRLMVFGSGVSSLLGHDPANIAPNLSVFNHEGQSLPLLTAMDLAALLARPRTKAGLWQRLLDWTGTTERD